HMTVVAVMGASPGTPNGITWLNAGAVPNGSTDWTGTVLDGNVLSHSADDNVNTEQCVSEEGGVSNAIIRNNIFTACRNQCLLMSIGPGGGCCGGGNVNANQIYNNLFQGCGTYGIEIACENTTGTFSSNLFYNNTFVLNPNESVSQTATICTSASNVFRNNIMYSAGSVRQMNWTKVDVTNLFENNLITTGAATAVTWNGAHLSGGPGYTCAQLTNIAASDIANCPSPVFVNASTDFHIQTSSPAKDAGTSTGMPTGRTADICNFIAVLHGLPTYQNCTGIQTLWDIGIHEFIPAGSSGNRRRGLIKVGPLTDQPFAPWENTCPEP